MDILECKGGESIISSHCIGMSSASDISLYPPSPSVVELLVKCRKRTPIPYITPVFRCRSKSTLACILERGVWNWSVCCLKKRGPPWVSKAFYHCHYFHISTCASFSSSTSFIGFATPPIFFLWFLFWKCVLCLCFSFRRNNSTYRGENCTNG